MNRELSTLTVLSQIHQVGALTLVVLGAPDGLYDVLEHIMACMMCCERMIACMRYMACGKHMFGLYGITDRAIQ